jgi:GT2 family glycosyltransferase/glycosyltransferase involved in cell wall biosynthesis
MENLKTPAQVFSTLYWAFDKARYLHNQSCRSWAFWGSETGSLDFSIPALSHPVESIRLSLEPIMCGLKLVRATFHGQRKTITIDSKNIDFEPASSPSATTSFYTEPTDPACLASVCFDLKSPDLLSLLAKGGRLSLEFAFEQNNGGINNAFIDAHEIYTNLHASHPNKLTDLRLRAAVWHSNYLSREAIAMRSALDSVYTSHSWRITQLGREFTSWVKGNRNSYVLAKISKHTLIKALANFNQESLDMKIEITKKTVDIVIPIHNSYQSVKNCIASVLSSGVRQKHEIVLIDDASTDPKLITYLDDLAKNQLVTLLRNQNNIGFTGSVKRGIAQHLDRDVVILNSDTKVANDWLDRLMRAAYSYRKIGTVTPFSNNATICSYPLSGCSNKLPSDCSLGDLDFIFKQVNAKKIIDIPTAVGFCTYLRRDALIHARNFDNTVFPGYGEENDLSLRIARAGYRNILAADCFVFHEGETSYGQTCAAKRMRAYDALVKIHPQYEENLRTFLRQDSCRSVRNNVTLERLRRLKKPIVLSICHAMGGGTQKHVVDLAKKFGKAIETLELYGDNEKYTLSWLNQRESLHFEFFGKSEFPELMSILKGLSISRIHIHHISGFFDNIKQLVDELKLPFDFTVHDFYSVCPQVALSDYRKRYCGQPDEKGCNECIAITHSSNFETITQWRGKNAWLINQAQRVFVPTNDTLKRIKGYFPSREYIVVPHLEPAYPNYQAVKATLLSDSEPLRIIVLGALGPEKGADLLELCAIDALTRKLAIEFHLLGVAYRPLRSRPDAALTIYGQYNDKDIVRLIRQVRPHLIWFPVLIPETYSYTLSASLKAGVPIVAPNLGAFPERLANRDWTWIGRWNQQPEQWNNLFVSISNENFKTGKSPSMNFAKTTISQFSYEKDYTVPILR